MKITTEMIWINYGWVHVDGIGRIGLYSSYDHTLRFDYSMKWIVGTNEQINCNESEIKNHVLNLFNNVT